MQTVLAAAPVLCVLGLMIGRGWAAGRAGALTAGLTLALAIAAFDFGGAQDSFGLAEGAAGVFAEAAFVSATVVAIIGPALGIHHLQEATGATAVLRTSLARLHPDPRVGALVIAWFFTLFLEGAAGFGTPVALAAPFLVAAGFRPVSAVTSALVGHAAGVSFGAVGTPAIAQLTLVPDIDARELARWTASYHLALGWLLVVALLLIIGRALPGQRVPWGWAAVAAVSFFAPFGLIAVLMGPELPTLGGALIGVTAFALVASRGRRSDPRSAPTSGQHPTMSLVRAASPYLVLVALVAATRLVGSLDELLGGVRLEWRTQGGFTGSVSPLVHPAFLLALAFGAGALVQGAPSSTIWLAFSGATRRLGGVVLALVAMVAIARTMSHAGMTDQLAAAAANTGTAWPLVAPAVGALGTFMTGSATASNVLFTELQASTAQAARLPVAPVVGAQGFGAAVGNIICPHNIVAAAATVGLTGAEGSVLRHTLPVAGTYLLLGGLLGLAVTL